MKLGCRQKARILFLDALSTWPIFGCGMCYHESSQPRPLPPPAPVELSGGLLPPAYARQQGSTIRLFLSLGNVRLFGKKVLSRLPRSVVDAILDKTDLAGYFEHRVTGEDEKFDDYRGYMLVGVLLGGVG